MAFRLGGAYVEIRGNYDRMRNDLRGAKSEFGRNMDAMETRARTWQRNIAAFATGAIASLGIARLTKDVYESGRAFAATEKAYKEITGSAKAASAEFAYLRSLADATGQNFYALTSTYKGFLAASQKTNLEGQKTRDVFSSVTRAAATLGLSTDQTSGALYAIQQMMSKGTVQSEELRQQLGERLPGAYNLMAEAMGVSAGELQKMLERGEVLADVALPKLARVLNERYSGEVSEAVRASNKFTEALEDLRVQAAKSGFLDSMAGALGDISDVLADPVVQAGMSDAASGFGQMSASAAEFAAAELPGMIEDTTATLKSLHKLFGVVSRAMFGNWSSPAFLADAVVKLNEVIASVARLSDASAVEIVSVFDISNMSDVQKKLNSIRLEIKMAQQELDMSPDLMGFGADPDEMREKLAMLREQYRIISEMTGQEVADESYEIDYGKRTGQEVADDSYEIDYGKRVVEAAQSTAAAKVEYAKMSANEIAVILAESGKVDHEELMISSKRYKATAKDKQKIEQALDDMRAKLEKERPAKQKRINDQLLAMDRSLSSEKLEILLRQQREELDAHHMHMIEMGEGYEDYVAQTTAAEQARVKALLLAHGSFVDGVKLGFDDLSKRQTTWASAGVATVQTWASTSRSVASNVFFDAFTGDLRTVGDYADMVWNGIARGFADMLGKMVTEYAVSGVKDLLTGEGGGSLVGGIIGAAGGIWDAVDWLGSDTLGLWKKGAYLITADQIAQLHKGEMVVPAEQAEALRAMIEASGGGVGWGDGVTSAVGGAATGFSSSLAEAFSTAALVSSIKQAGTSLVGKGSFSPQAVLAAGLLGMTSEAVNIGFDTVSTPTTQKFSFISAAALGSMFGPVGAAFGAVFGETIAESIMDALGIRADESLLDAAEMGLGSMTSARDVAAALAKATGFADDTSFDGASGTGSMSPSEAAAAMTGATTEADDPGHDGMGGGGGAMGGGISGDTGAEAGDFSRGGWASGPISGYTANLHGTEYVLNRDQIKAIRDIGGGRGGGVVRIYFDSPELARFVRVQAEGVQIQREMRASRGLRDTTGASPARIT
jgi:tape measure domain-containing protein